MNRRFFSKLVALGAGSLGMWQAQVRGDDEAAETPPAKAPSDAPQEAAAQRTATPNADRDQREPVNVADFQELAKAALPQATYDYITTGSTDEITLHDNVAAFQRLRILPPLLTGVAEADTATSVLKQPIALPILLAPVAGQSLYHPQGALASARAAATAKTIMGVSSSRSLLVS